MCFVAVSSVCSNCASFSFICPRYSTVLRRLQASWLLGKWLNSTHTPVLQATTCQTCLYADSESILASKLLPRQNGFDFILSPVEDQPIRNFDNRNSMRLYPVPERILANTNLSTGIEYEVVPDHVHRQFSSLRAAKEFVQSLTSAMWRRRR